MEEEDLDGERILIIYKDDTQRKETKLVDSSVLEGNLALFEDSSMKNDHQYEDI